MTKDGIFFKKISQSCLYVVFYICQMYMRFGAGSLAYGALFSLDMTNCANTDD